MSREPDQPILRPPGSVEATTHQAGKSRDRRILIWSLAGVLLVLALIVLTILPTKIAHRNQTQTTHIESGQASPALTDPAPITTPAAAPISGISQHDAGLALQAFLRLRAQVDLQAAEIWAPEPWTKAMLSAEQGDDHYGHRRFKEALIEYETATQQLIQLQSDRPQILLYTLASAQSMLRENKVTPAINAFERVLAMQAGHAQAQADLAQARVRQQVLGLMKEGQGAEAADKLPTAADAYRAALSMDSRYEPARSALDIVSEQLARTAYQNAMSQALSHIDAGNFKAAEDALKIAANIDADTTGLQDANRRLQDARRQFTLNTLRKQAQKAAAKESWGSAIASYRKALLIDKQATFARSGLKHAEARQELNAQLDHYLEAPERLSSERPLINARKLMAANAGTPENEPLLTSKLSELGNVIKLASTPVTLIIESDKQTEVTIYHVGRMGVFEQKEIQLRPGRYTVTGSREGYRDVRKIISLRPATPERLSIRCEERI